MSELAFTQSGDLFDVPAVVTGWRVRRLKPRGAPELVYGKDGCPLTIPIEADMNDLRDAVGGVLGKYRLDPMNEDGKVVDGTPPAYVHVVKAEAAVDANVVAPRDDANSVMRDAMRLNTELAKSIVDKFPEMMHAAAELLRAADGAGLPARQPRENTDDQDEVEDAATVPPGGIDINAIIAQVVPMLVMAFASGDKSKLPSLAEMLDWRKAVPKTKVLAAPIDVAPPSPSTDTKSAVASGDVMERVSAVLAELTSDERMLAIAMAQELSADERAAWFAELAPLSVADAVARVRKVLSGKKERVS